LACLALMAWERRPRRLPGLRTLPWPPGP
jgi:hypothetical protein